MNTHISFLKHSERFGESSIFLLLGPEDFPLKAILEKLKGDGEVVKLLGDEVSLDDVRKHFTPSLLGNRSKVVLIRNFTLIKDWQSLMEVPRNVKLVLYEPLDYEETDERKLIAKANEWIRNNMKNTYKFATIYMPYLNRELRKKWILRKCKELKLSLTDEQVDRLLEIHPPSLHAVWNELVKLSLARDIPFDSMFFEQSEDRIFSLMNKLKDGHYEWVFNFLEMHSRDSLNILSYLQRYLLNLIYSKEALKKNVKPSFMYRRYESISRKYYHKELYEKLTRSLATEKLYKTSHSETLALLEFIVEEIS